MSVERTRDCNKCPQTKYLHHKCMSRHGRPCFFNQDSAAWGWSTRDTSMQSLVLRQIMNPTHGNEYKYKLFMILSNPMVLLKRILVILPHFSQVITQDCSTASTIFTGELTKWTQRRSLQHKIYEVSKPETSWSFPDLTTYFKVSFGQLGFRNQLASCKS